MSAVNEDNNSELPRVRPGWLTAICVLAIVFGALGLITGAFSLLGQLFASQLQTFIMSAQGSSNVPGAEIQKEVMTRSVVIASRYRMLMIPLTLGKALVAALLLLGGIFSLSLKNTGRTLLVRALLAALVVESLLFVPTTLAQRESQALMSELMPKMMQSQQGPNGPPPGFNAGMSAMFSVIGTATLLISLAWLAAKIVIYLLGIRYLRKPKIVALFE